ncbi:MAG: metallophosphoesterase [Rubrobacter sp.]|jgi:Icc-related predicted phosphoesterase|nr:metallophosphoesterase [Rubrobacter sp.]
MKLLCISDREESMLHGPTLNAYADGVDAVISSGDLSFGYLEYIVTFLGVPVYYVLGNHDPGLEEGKYPGGCIPLDGRIVDAGGVVLAGLSGSRFYSGGPNQYTDRQMKWKTLGLSARIRGRSLLGRPKPTVFVTHAAPKGYGDAGDHAHVGFESFLGMVDKFEPPLWLHGHVHLYGHEQEKRRVTKRGDTKMVNVYGHLFLEV